MRPRVMLYFTILAIAGNLPAQDSATADEMRKVIRLVNNEDYGALYDILSESSPIAVDPELKKKKVKAKLKPHIKPVTVGYMMVDGREVVAPKYRKAHEEKVANEKLVAEMKKKYESEIPDRMTRQEFIEISRVRMQSDKAKKILSRFRGLTPEKMSASNRGDRVIYKTADGMQVTLLREKGAIRLHNVEIPNQ